MSENAPIISLRAVTKKFGGLTAVSNVTCDIAYGERRLFIGTNGAGKTTLFNLIAGDYPVTSGEIMIFGKAVHKLNVQKRVHMGMRRTYQTSALMDGISVRMNFYLALLGEKTLSDHLNFWGRALKDRPTCERIEKAAQDIGLYDKLDVDAIELSHGERRQLELGTALITRPRLLLLDEPAAGLSTEERHNLVRIINSLPRDITVVLIEHDMTLAFAVADYVTVMYDGEVVAQGTPEEIQSNELVRDIYLGGAPNAEDKQTDH